LSEVAEENAPLEAPGRAVRKRPKEHPRGVAGTIWALEHAQDLMSVIVGVLLVGLAAVVLVVGVVDFFRDPQGKNPGQQALATSSGWRDSNPRPRAPKARALAKLRYSPLATTSVSRQRAILAAAEV
jgi:hypothetical protein